MIPSSMTSPPGCGKPRIMPNNRRSPKKLSSASTIRCCACGCPLTLVSASGSHTHATSVSWTCVGTLGTGVRPWHVSGLTNDEQKLRCYVHLRYASTIAGYPGVATIVTGGVRADACHAGGCADGLDGGVGERQPA